MDKRRSRDTLVGLALAFAAGLVLVMVVAPQQAAAQGKKGQPRVIELEEETIKGRVQKPEAFYILQHASLNYKRLDARESFIPELVETVKRNDF